jgi:cytidylate kinase
MAVITISRLYGSGGHALAERLAKDLGYTLWDKEIIKQVAERGNVSTGEVKGFERYGGSRLMRLLDKLVTTDYITRLSRSEIGILNEKRYVELVQEIVTEIYVQDNAVILGRGAQFILADKPGAMHVLLVAGDEWRKSNLSKLDNPKDMSPESLLRSEDQRRRDFLSCFGGDKSPNDPSLYHQCLNQGLLDQDKVAKLILAMIS